MQWINAAHAAHESDEEWEDEEDMQDYEAGGGAAAESMSRRHAPSPPRARSKERGAQAPRQTQPSRPRADSARAAGMRIWRMHCTQQRAVVCIGVALVLLVLGVVVHNMRSSQERALRRAAPIPDPLVVRDLRFRLHASQDHQRQHTWSNATALEANEECTPPVLDPKVFGHGRHHRFYDYLGQVGPLPPPIFRGAQTLLCNEFARFQSQFGFCLPINGRMDEPYCNGADRMDLLLPHSPETLCAASVLHMLMIDVYEELKEFGASPLLAFGTLLGAVRNGSLIPYTDDVDIAYRRQSELRMYTLRAKLWRRGYHMFKFNIWRVCVAPTHPLASTLFSGSKGLARDYSVPYVDLYEMNRVVHQHWAMYGRRSNRLMQTRNLWPPSHVRVNGMSFQTVAKPTTYLIEEYGNDFMTPYRRPPLRMPKHAFNFFDNFENAREPPGTNPDRDEEHQDDTAEEEEFDDQALDAMHDAPREAFDSDDLFGDYIEDVGDEEYEKDG